MVAGGLAFEGGLALSASALEAQRGGGVRTASAGGEGGPSWVVGFEVHVPVGLLLKDSSDAHHRPHCAQRCLARQRKSGRVCERIHKPRPQSTSECEPAHIHGVAQRSAGLPQQCRTGLDGDPSGCRTGAVTAAFATAAVRRRGGPDWPVRLDALGPTLAPSPRETRPGLEFADV